MYEKNICFELDYLGNMDEILETFNVPSNIFLFYMPNFPSTGAVEYPYCISDEKGTSHFCNGTLCWPWMATCNV